MSKCKDYLSEWLDTKLPLTNKNLHILAMLLFNPDIKFEYGPKYFIKSPKGTG